ncbi:GNAT family N-acetyltransferase [Spirosoma sp. KCTC 42546]|uniref:GNAT family N-acetyltransferase n=1 Tax=Spirosoma sp. KCTC 42546 TaxID=2520506 RepID=UPI00115A4FD0|nr:GNAT family N-acetyltransferase [Spirosoma sp. KCTC 42546]QDK79408.1 GNAT family N-acetyltransferase [Spirosoma sp. KCTC 42546]
MTIRPATPSDIPALVTLLQHVIPLMHEAGNFQWDDHYPNETVFGQDISKQQLWVADIDGQLAGVAALTEDQEPEYAQVGFDLNQRAIVTHRLAVDPNFRGQGVAVALLEQAEKLALEHGISFLRIDTNSENQSTQKLFPKLGYQYAGEITLGFRPGLRFLAYEKKLN